jgi:hypothetical protein
MKWCCEMFSMNFEMAGSRGFGVFATDDSSYGIGFVIQHRALEPDGEPPEHAASPLSLVSEMRINCCPWCGTNLAEYYGESRTLMRPDLKL